MTLGFLTALFLFEVILNPKPGVNGGVTKTTVVAETQNKARTLAESQYNKSYRVVSIRRVKKVSVQ